MSGTILEIMRRPPADVEAGRQYARGIEHLFDIAHDLVRMGRTDDAEAVAKWAVDMRDLARHEVRVP